MDEVIAPGIEGELGILPDHTPLLTLLKIGILTYRKGNELHYIAVDHGFLEVRDNMVTVLVEEAEQPSEIDKEKAERDKKEAEERLKELGLDSEEYPVYFEALEKAVTRIKVCELK